MTHAPHGAGAGRRRDAARPQQQQQQRRRASGGDKQVEELLPPPTAKGAEAMAAAVPSSEEESALALRKAPGLEGVATPDDARSAASYAPPPPPDGGWGWVVVFGSFMIHIVNDGITYSFGIFYEAFREFFGSGAGETSLILSILVGVTLCSGPISSSFVNKYGCRPVTIVGAVLGAAALALSVFAPNVQTLYITIGIGTGFGFGLVYLPAIVSVTCYFERLRSLATGIAVCGSGLGTFIMAPITKELVEHLGWRRAILCVSGMVLSCAGFGALFRPLKVEPVPLAEAPSAGELAPKRAAACADLPLQKERERPLLAEAEEEEEEQRRAPAGAGAGGALRRPRSVGHLAPPSALPRSSQRGPAAAGAGPAARLALSQPALAASYTRVTGMGSVETKLMDTPTLSRKGSGIMYRKDILYSGSLANLDRHRSTTHLAAEGARLVEGEGEAGAPPAANGLTPPLAAAAAAEGAAASPPCAQCSPCCAPSPETADALREMLDFSLLRDPIFILFTISNFLTSIGYNVPYLYIASQAQDRGLSKDQGAWALSVIGIANTIGRIVLGYISDKSWVNRLLVYNLCLTICGVATAFSALCQSYVSFLLYACVFGCSIGAYVGLTSVVLVDLLGLDRLTNAFGLLLLFQGIASFVGPPITGWLQDVTDSYDPGFIVAGVTMALSGVMLFVIPPVQRHLSAKEATSMEMRSVNGDAHAVAA